MATIYSYSSNSVYCNYTLSISRSGEKITLTAKGTLYGSSGSSDSNRNLYAHLCYNVSPSNSDGNATTYVSSYGTTLGGKIIVEKPLNSSRIPSSGKEFSVSWTIENNSAITYNNCALFLSKSASDASDSSGNAYAFIGKKASSLSAAKTRYYTQTLSIGAGYTSCTSPTSVKISDSIQRPGGAVTITWSGAKAGNSNAITKYRIYWQWDSDPTSSSYAYYKDVSSTSTSGSTSITITSDSSYRGKTCHFKIQTIGTVSGYNASTLSDKVTCKINSLPTISSLSASYKKIPYSGGLSTITIAGNSNDGSQTLSFYYEKPSGSKVSFSSGNSISIPASDDSSKDSDYTINFYAYDGLEYSSSKTLTFSRIAEPTIVAHLSPYFDLDPETISAQAYETTNKAYYKQYTAYADDVGAEDDDLYDYHLYTSSSFKNGKYGVIGSNYSSKRCSFNFLETVQELDLDYSLTDNFWVVIVRKRNIGYIERVTNSDSSYSNNDYYTLPSYPALSTYYNNAEEKPATLGDSNDYFNNYVTVLFEKDTGITGASVRYSNLSSGISGSFLPSSVSFALDNDGCPRVVIDCSNLTRGALYSFTINLTRGGSSTKEYVISSLTRIKTAPFQSSGGNLSTTLISARKWESDVIATGIHNLATASVSDLQLYGLDFKIEDGTINQDNSRSTLKIGYSLSNSSTIDYFDAHTFEKSETGITTVLSGDMSDEKSDLQTVRGKLFSEAVNGTKIVKFYYTIKNVFGLEQTITIGSLTYNFQEEIDFERVTSTFEASYSSKTIETFSSNMYFRTNWDLGFYLTGGTYYNSDDIIATLYVGYASERKAPSSLSYKEVSSSIVTVSATYNGESFEKSLYFTFKTPCLDQKESYYTYFKVIISQNNHSSTETIFFGDLQLVKQQPPTINITDVSISDLTLEDEKLKFLFTFSADIDFNWEVINDSSFKMGHYYDVYLVENPETKTKIIGQNTVAKDGTTKPFQEDNQKSQKITNLQFDCSVSTTLTTIPTVFVFNFQPVTEDYIDDSSNERLYERCCGGDYVSYVYYYISPTFSYRANQVGINTASLENNKECAAVISSYDNKKFIKLVGVQGEGTSTSSVERYIDINNGYLTNFKLNGSFWGDANKNDSLYTDKPSYVHIARGETTPKTEDLHYYELGYETSKKRLWINDNGTVRKIGGQSLTINGYVLFWEEHKDIYFYIINSEDTKTVWDRVSDEGLILFQYRFSNDVIINNEDKNPERRKFFKKADLTFRSFSEGVGETTRTFGSTEYIVTGLIFDVNGSMPSGGSSDDPYWIPVEVIYIP